MLYGFPGLRLAFVDLSFSLFRPAPKMPALRPALRPENPARERGERSGRRDPSPSYPMMQRDDSFIHSTIYVICTIYMY